MTKDIGRKPFEEPTRTILSPPELTIKVYRKIVALLFKRSPSRHGE
jgi:hypothetical protein